MAASAGDLTTVAYFRTITGIASGTIADATVEAYITAVSDELKRLTGRTFIAGYFSEDISGYNRNRLYIIERPIIDVLYVTDEKVNAMRVKFENSATLATAEVERRTSLKLRSETSGTLTTNTLAFATYTTLTTLVAAAEALTGWTAERLTTDAAYQDPDRLLRFEGGDALNSWLTIETVGEPITDWHVGPNDDYIEKDVGCWYAGRQNYHVYYTGGYGDPTASEAATQAAALPKSLQLLVCRMALHLYHTATRDYGIESERLGDYSYKLATQPNVSTMSSWPADIQRDIQRWSRPMLTQ